MSGESAPSDAASGTGSVSSVGDEAGRVVDDANKLLRCIGYEKPIASVAELQDTASSLVVASFEAIFGVRLAEVRRFPKCPEDYEHNAGCMLDALRRLLPAVPLPHEVTVEQLCNGHVGVLHRMILLFLELDSFLATPGAAGYFSTPAGSANTSIHEHSPQAPSDIIPKPAAAAAAATYNDEGGDGGLGSLPEEHLGDGSGIEQGQVMGDAGFRRDGGTVSPISQHTTTDGSDGGSDGDAGEGSTPSAARADNPPAPRAPAQPVVRPQAQRRVPATSASARPPAPVTAWAPHDDGEAQPDSRQARGARNKRKPQRTSRRFRGARGVNHTLQRQVRASQHRERRMQVSSMRHQVRNMNEVWTLQVQHRRAVRDRVAAMRKYERDLLHRSLSQRRALRHAYKVDAIRARKMARSLQNETLALRARRSSLQTALASKLVKATMQAERAACEDRKRVIVADTEAVLKTALAVAVSSRERVNVQKRLAREQALEQQVEREIAAKAQRMAFRQAARDLANAHVAEFQRLRDIARHREDRFIAEVVEPLDMHAVRGLMPVDPLLLLEAHTTSADVRKAKRLGRRPKGSKRTAATTKRHRKRTNAASR